MGDIGAMNYRPIFCFSHRPQGAFVNAPYNTAAKFIKTQKWTVEDAGPYTVFVRSRKLVRNFGCGTSRVLSPTRPPKNNS